MPLIKSLQNIPTVNTGFFRIGTELYVPETGKSISAAQIAGTEGTVIYDRLVRLGRDNPDILDGGVLRRGRKGKNVYVTDDLFELQIPVTGGARVDTGLLIQNMGGEVELDDQFSVYPRERRG